MWIRFRRQSKIKKKLKVIASNLDEIQLAIMQIPKAKRNIFLKAISGKAAGLASMHGITTTISTFGFASTGTAIASLSGAAQLNATMYAIGGVVGGGVFAGGIILALAGIGIGFGLRNFLGNLWYGSERKNSSLNADEMRIRELCASLSHSINEYLEDHKKQNTKFEIEDVKSFLTSGIDPLISLIKNSEQTINNNLRIGARRGFKYAFKKIVSNKESLEQDLSVPAMKFVPTIKFSFLNFQENQTKENLLSSASVCFLVFTYKLLSHKEINLSYHEDLILAAFRRSAERFENASPEEIREYITQLEPNAVTGWFSNAKGIYHELLWADRENKDGDPLMARLFENTNHAGSDIEFVIDGDVVKEVQFKAVADPESIARHFERYPDIEVYATTEVANEVSEIYSNVTDSGFSLKDIDNDMKEFMFPGNSDIVQDAEAGALIGLLVSVLKNRRGSPSFKNKIKDTLKHSAVGGSTAIALEYVLFG